MIKKLSKKTVAKQDGDPDQPVAPKKSYLTPKRKKILKWGGGGLLVAFIVYLATAPQYGSMQYGVCRTIIEMNEPFPEELRVMQVEDGIRKVRIYYSVVGTFGEHRSNIIDCTFKVDEAGNVSRELEKVDLNGKRKYNIESPEYIKKFNLGVPGIVANPPDLALPWVNLQDIRGYWEAERRN